jgi:hypothetical protein
MHLFHNLVSWKDFFTSKKIICREYEEVDALTAKHIL